MGKLSATKFLAILPHSNIERAIGKIQEEIFNRFGLTSALALPPLIPLEFVSVGFDCSMMSSVLEPRPIGLSVRTLSLRASGNALYLGVEMQVGGMELKPNEMLEGDSPCPADQNRRVPLFPIYPGFFLCVAKDAKGAEELAQAIAAPPAMSFHPLGVGLLSLMFPSSESWWDHIYWEIEAMIKLRRGPKGTVPGAPQSPS